MLKPMMLGLSLLILTGCQTGSEEAKDRPQEEKASERSTAPSSGAADLAADLPTRSTPKSAAAKPKEVVIDDAIIRKYISYRKEWFEALEVELAKLGENIKGVEHSDNVPAVLLAIQRNERIGVRLNEIEKQLQKKYGLTAKTRRKLEKLVGDVITARQLWHMSGEQSMAAMEGQIKAQLAAVPPEMRGEMKANLEKMKEAFAKMRDATDAREKHGDKAVDIVLAHEKELMEIHKRLLNSLGAMGR